MSILSAFLANVCILFCYAYLCNLLYKYGVEQASPKLKNAFFIAIFVLAGWLSMRFGVNGENFTLFDLRAVPIIFGTLFFKKPWHLFLTGAGIAAARFAIAGISLQAVTGAINILLLGSLGAVLVHLYQKKPCSYRQQAMISTFSIITFQVACITTFGAIPREYYVAEVLPYTFPAGIGFSLFFLLMLNEFYKEQSRSQKLRNMNMFLREQTKELLQTKRDLEDKAKQLQTASRYKSEFIANMSHEFKTPLNSVILLSQMIKENEEGVYRDEDIQYASIIHNAGNDLLKIIDDILDLSKVEAGKLELHIEWVSVDDLLELIHGEFEPLSQKKGLHFQISLSPDVPSVLLTDVLRLRQILRNLVMNAMKFTEKGSVNVRVGMADGQVVFTVSDTGIGISPDKRDMIFDAFQQEDGAHTRKFGGTGLGLSISLHLAKLLGGNITVESVKGKGSRFSVVLPVSYPSATPEETGVDCKKVSLA